MIDAGTSIIATGVVVTAGHWSADKKLTVQTVAGFGVLAMCLAVMGQSDADLAGKFALLVLLASFYKYGPAIAKAMGYTK